MAIRKFRKVMKPFIMVITTVFLLSLVYGGYQELRGTLLSKKAMEAFKLNKKVVSKIEIERAKNELQNSYSRFTKVQIDKSITDVIAINQVIDKYLTLDLAKKLKIKVPSSEVEKHYQDVENSIGDKEQFKRMLEIQGFSKDSYKAKIEEELLLEKTIQEFSKTEDITEQEIQEFYGITMKRAVNLDLVRDKIIEELKRVKAQKKYQESLSEARKNLKITNISAEYKDILEAVVYEEDGFKITNLDLAKETLNEIIKTGKNKANAESLAKANISKSIKIANIAKEKGIEVNANLDTLAQLNQYYEKLIEKYKKEIKLDENSLKNFFEKYSSRYEIRASADANIALVDIKYSKEDEEDTKIKAEKVLNEINIENFESKGLEFSKKDGYIFQDLGTFSKDMMVKEFEEAVKNTESNSIAKNVVKTSYGYHIIFVKENNSKEGKWTASHILIPFQISEKTIKNKLEKLEKIKDDINSRIVTFSQIKKLDEDIVESIEVKGIEPSGLIPNLGYSREISSAIFNSEINKVVLLEDSQLGVILLQKTKEISPKNPSFEEVKKEVEIDYINYKVVEYISSLGIKL